MLLQSATLANLDFTPLRVKLCAAFARLDGMIMILLPHRHVKCVASVFTPQQEQRLAHSVQQGTRMRTAIQRQSAWLAAQAGMQQRGQRLASIACLADMMTIPIRQLSACLAHLGPTLARG